jgi:hypothetical protein
LQTCSLCQTRSSDMAVLCPNCQANLRNFSTTAIALKHFLENPRVVAIRISVPIDACPACEKIIGTYPKADIPLLPADGCSENGGCRCFYEPVLSEIYP